MWRKKKIVGLNPRHRRNSQEAIGSLGFITRDQVGSAISLKSPGGRDDPDALNNLVDHIKGGASYASISAIMRLSGWHGTAKPDRQEAHSYLLAYMEHHHLIPRKTAGDMSDREVEAGAAIWTALCERVRDTTPESALLGEEGEQMVCEAYRILEYLKTMAGIEVAMEIQDLGPGLRQRLDGFTNWLKTEQEMREIRNIQLDLYPEIQDIVVENSCLAGTREGGYALGKLAYPVDAMMARRDATDVLHRNPAYNEDGYRGIVDAIMVKIRDQIYAIPTTLAATADPALFERAQENRWKIAPEQRELLRFLAKAVLKEHSRARKSDERMAHNALAAIMLSQIPEAGEITAIRKSLLELAQAPDFDGGNDVMAGLLSGSKGREWADVVSWLGTRSSQLARAAASRALSKATHSKIEGVLRGDLIRLISGPDPEVRVKAIGVAAKIKKAEQPGEIRAR